jgi:hypothetical protein
MDADDAIERLLANPVDVETARTTLPDRNGVYAWWTEHGAIPGVPAQPHPSEEALELFYVGIAPRDVKSSATLRSRIVGNHLGGNTGSSTFRLALAALLIDTLRLTPHRTKTKYVLPTAQSRVLSAWQQNHLKLSWVEHDTPWLIEDDIIAALRPPLNLAGNASHPFHSTLSEARDRFRQAAQDRVPQ